MRPSHTGSHYDKEKKIQVLADIDEAEYEPEMARVFDQLDSYPIEYPTPQMTLQLIETLKPVLTENTARQALQPRFKEQMMELAAHGNFFALLKLVRPQISLLGAWFIVFTTVVMLAGIYFSCQVGADSLRFLANASPILGILTLLYEYRAKRYGVSEMEAACPYSPGQLASARMMIVLCYDIVLCLIASAAVVAWQQVVLWNLILNWLSPLVFILGISLAISFPMGIWGGCLSGMTVWIMQASLTDGYSIFRLLLPQQPVMANLCGLAAGIGLLVYCLYYWRNADYWLDDVRAGDG